MMSNWHEPEQLSPKQLDDYLGNAWFRMGQSIFTRHFLFFDSTVYTALWIRLDLQDYTFKKRLRKILNRNRKAFQVVIRPAVLNKEKNQLYAKYKRNFNGQISDTLKEYLLDDTDESIFDTYECCVYEAEKLVAFSFFDVGEKSMASIMGVYDPEYSTYSLGFYTMLEEVNFGSIHQKRFYYPGYVVPDYQRFDYKLRIGAVDYYDVWKKKWLPYSTLKKEQLPSELLQIHLERLKLHLDLEEVPYEQLAYPSYDRHLLSEGADILNSPMFIILQQEEFQLFLFIIEYSLRINTYVFYKLYKFGEDYTIILKSNSPLEIVNAVQRELV